MLRNPLAASRMLVVLAAETQQLIRTLSTNFESDEEAVLDPRSYHMSRKYGDTGCEQPDS